MINRDHITNEKLSREFEDIVLNSDRIYRDLC